MAEANQVEAGLVGPTPSHDPVEPASVATLRSPSASELTPEGGPEAAAGTGDASAGADSEPSASVRGVPTWTFTVPPSGPPPAPAASASPAGSSVAAAAGFPPPPPAPPAPGTARTGATPAVQLLTVPSLGPAGEPRHPAVIPERLPASAGHRFRDGAQNRPGHNRQANGAKRRRPKVLGSVV